MKSFDLLGMFWGKCLRIFVFLSNFSYFPVVFEQLAKFLSSCSLKRNSNVQTNVQRRNVGKEIINNDNK